MPSSRPRRARRPLPWAGSLLCCGLVVAALATGPGCSEPTLDGPTGDGPPPNVLVYMVDTLRADALPVYGNTRVQAPAISRLASEGIVYEQTFAASSWTRASVASLLSGLQPDVHNVRDRTDWASAPVARLASAFRDAGYRTGAIVTNANVGRFFGFGEGFDDYVELFEQQDDPLVVDQRTPRARADAVTRRAAEWISGGDAPWLLFVLVSDPHSPYAPPPGFDLYELDDEEIERRFSGRGARNRLALERKRRKYWGEVSFTDRAFGELLDRLRETGRYDDTLVVLTADHGEHFGEQGKIGHGSTLYQAVLHIPLIVKLPGSAYAGRRIAAPVQLVDVHPTLLAAAGLASAAASEPWRPGDAAPLPLEEPREPRPAFAQLDLDQYRAEMVYVAPWKYLRPPPEPSHRVKTREGLYALAEDPREGRNELDRWAATRDELRAWLDTRAETSRARSAAVVTPLEGRAAEMPEQVREALEHMGYIEPRSSVPEAGAPAPAP